MKTKDPAVPTVSIVTPSYNQGQFIEETIVSVLSQEGDIFLEYIIMDGGSTDSSVDIIKRYDRILQQGDWNVACRGISFSWSSGKDDGQADAINNGLAAASGEIVGWINSDDTYLPGALAKAVNFFQAHPEAVMVYGNAYYIDRRSVVTGSYPSEPFRLKRLAENCFICQPASFIRSEALASVGKLDADLQASMDYELWIRMGKKFTDRIFFLEEFLATSRMYPENKTNAIRDRVLKENLAFLQRHFGYVEGIQIASCFYDIYESRRDISFRETLKRLQRRKFVLSYLLNVRTFHSTMKYFISNVGKIFQVKG